MKKLIKNTFIVWLIRPLFDRRHWYRKYYLQSNHWEKKRLKKRKSVGFRCENCESPAYKVRLDVHHLTYKHLFREGMSDLQVLCRRCHREEHEYEG